MRHQSRFAYNIGFGACGYRFNSVSVNGPDLHPNPVTKDV